MTGRDRQRGFSLIEVMIVVAIIGIIASIAVPVFTRAMEKAHRNAVGVSMRDLYVAMTSYYTDNGEFAALDPATFEPLVSGGYFDDPTSLLRKLQGNKVWVYYNLGVQGWWMIVHPKGDPESLIYAGRLDVGSTPIYDGVYWYKPGETSGIRRIDGAEVW